MFLAVAILYCGSATADDGLGVENHPQFRGRYQRAAECVVQESGQQAGTFYFPKVKKNWESEGAPWVYWIEGNELILFTPQLEDAPLGDLSRSSRRLNLKADIVEKPEDLGTSTYLEHRAWADERIAEAKQGTKVQVSPPQNGNRCP